VEKERPWGAAPSPRLVGLGLGVSACACLAPWAPGAASLAALVAAGAVAAASFDLMWSRGPGLRVEVVGEDGAAVERLRLREGHPQALRLAIQWGTAGKRAPRWMALMAGNADFAGAIETPAGRWRLRPSGAARELWQGEVAGRARGRFRGLRCGLEQASRLGLWRMREWQTLACEFCVYPDWAAGRRALLRSPVYRALAAAAAMPLTGQGREFERLREYQSGDNYADVSWKATARRAHPVTRLYQWEQQQEIYFVVEHGRLSRRAGGGGRRPLERYIETALVGATAAAELGDRFGLISFADEVSQWVAAGSGRAHFRACRERLLELKPQRVTPNFERLFAAIRTRLRRRCYLLFLTDLTERGLAESFRQAAGLVRRTHLLLATSLLPPEARPLGQRALPAEAGVEAVYGELAADRELRRIEGLRAQLAVAGVQFRAVPEGQFLLAAIHGYLEGKREQRL